MTIADTYAQAQLAEAAYADFWDESLGTFPGCDEHAF
jgi:hypothetical protein